VVEPCEEVEVDAEVEAEVEAEAEVDAVVAELEVVEVAGLLPWGGMSNLPNMISITVVPL